MANLSVRDVTCTEIPQELDYTDSALDKVVDPCTEFQLQHYALGVKSPSEAFNLPNNSMRKYSLISLRGKQSHKVDNELPRVHRTSSTQSVVNMLRKEQFKRNYSDSSEYNGSDKTVLSSVTNMPYNYDCASMKNFSSGACTPSFKDDDDSPILPNYMHDRIETASNISLTSNLTDVPRSNISSVSDLTGYEEELYQIKKLVHGSTQSIYRPEFALHNRSSNDEILAYEHKIEELEAQLQETLGENEKYKFDLKDLETKVELIWQEKFREVMRQKAQCEGQLENVRKQYESALSEKEKLLNNFRQGGAEDNSLRAEFAKLQLKLNSLEKQGADQNSRFVLACNESRQWQAEFLKTEAENEKLRITLQEMKSGIDSKNSVLFGLKNKITEQHIELQNNIQAKLKLNNHITTLNNDIEAVKKSEKWYTDQLHSCQLAKSNIQQELMSTQTNFITATQKFENMKLEISHWKNMCEEVQKKAMREKEKLLRKVEMIESDILEREAILKCTQSENNTKIELNYVSKNIDDASDYKLILEDHEEQLTNLKKVIGNQNATIENQHKQNTDYLVRLTTLQKKINEKEISTQIIENRNRDLEMKCNSFTEDLRTKDNELLDLRNKIVNMEVALHAANREKEEIDEVVKNIRDDFNKFMKCYQGLKEKLEEKTRIINQFEHEKQELFMENNWKVCEIEELHHKILDIKGLQAEIVELKNAYNQLLIDRDMLSQENSALIAEKQDLETYCESLRIKISNLEENLAVSTKHQDFVLSQDNNVVKNRNQETGFETPQVNGNNLNENLKTMKHQEWFESRENLTKLTKDITNLENEILKLNEMLRIREEQLLNQTKNCEFFNCEIEAREKVISDLQEKLAESVNRYEKNSNKFSEVEHMNLTLQSKISDLNKKLSDANSVIEQFNSLCRNSEMEKHNLATQLNLLKKEMENNSVKNSTEPSDKELSIVYQDSDTQTDFSVETLATDSELENIKIRLLELISENNNVSNEKITSANVNMLYSSDTLDTINEYLNKVLNLKESQMKQLETSEKANKILRGKLLKLKNKVNPKLCYLKERCARLDNNYQQLHKVVEVIMKFQSSKIVDCKSAGSQTDLEIKDYQTSQLMQDVRDLKTLLRVNDMERKEQYKRFETNNRTLLKKVKEHMRGRKTVEKKLTSVQETYTCALTEINNLKLLNNRQEIELATFKTRCEDYKSMCDKQNEDIIKLEKEKSQISTSETPKECLSCLDKEKLDRELKEVQYKYKSLEDKIHWYEKEISDKEQGITECKKQLFNEKLQCSALKKQISSIQMCLDNANEQLDGKQIEFGHLKSVVEKLEINEKLLMDQLENAHIQYQECKRKLEATIRLLDEKTAKDEILADEIKTLSCHLHQKTLELTNVENKYALLESQTSSKENSHQKTVDDLHENLVELQAEIDQIRNDKFFLQRLCADLKMSLQGTLNQNKVLKLRLEALENETKDLTEKLNIPSPSKIDEEYINRLLQQSTVLPDKPLKNLRSCLDSLKQEMATLQKEIIAKTQSDMSL